MRSSCGRSCKNGDDANLENVRRLLTEADEYDRTYDKKGKATDELVKGLASPPPTWSRKAVMRLRASPRASPNASNELASVRSTADTQTRWILSPPMREDLKKKEGVDFRKLKERVPRRSM